MGSIKSVYYVTNSAYSSDDIKRVVKVNEATKSKNLLNTPFQKALVEEKNKDEDILTLDERNSIIVNDNEETLSSQEIYELMKPSSEIKKNNLFRKK
jgi:hypothetical protein